MFFAALSNKNDPFSKSGHPTSVFLSPPKAGLIHNSMHIMFEERIEKMDDEKRNINHSVQKRKN
jgi:hypothetical protein